MRVILQQGPMQGLLYAMPVVLYACLGAKFTVFVSGVHSQQFQVVLQG